MKKVSLKNYQMVVETGLLSKQQKVCFEWFSEYCPCTVNELISKVGKDFKKAYSNPIHINKTPSLLESHGLIAASGMRKCKATGNLSIVWELTANSPVPIKRKTTRKEQLLKLKEKIVEMDKLLNEILK